MPETEPAQPLPPRPHVLREYALLADGERGALLGPDGHVVWLCLPHWHSDPVFAGLLGGAGDYQVAPADAWSVWSGHYEPGRLIWRSRWATRDTLVYCREALARPAEPHKTTLLRQLRTTDTPQRFHATLGPVTDPHRERRHWTARLGEYHLRWSGAADAELDPATHCLRLDLTLPADHCHDLVLEISDHPLTGSAVAADTAWPATENAWDTTVPDFSDTLAPADAAHSYAVLHGLTAASGGMVAAATTSLPEREQSGSNYDYRYAWIRDQCWVGQAIAAHGPHPLVRSAVEFVTARLLADGPDVRPAYTVTGESVPPERQLPLPGYPGGRDVVGNRVTDQFQLDAFGEALSLFAAAARHEMLDTDAWRAAQLAADAVTARWREPEAGLWELDSRMWTESRLACVAGLRAMAAVAPQRLAGEWSARADRLLASVAATSVHATGRWQRTPDDERVDGALLLGALRGAVPAEDPRSVATYRAVCDELGRDGYLYRFRHDHRELGEAEGAFLVCGLIAALAAQQQGEITNALRWFDRTRGTWGPARLFAEEYDVTRRQYRGNLPQAFVHGLFIEAATRLTRP